MTAFSAAVAGANPAATKSGPVTEVLDLATNRPMNPTHYVARETWMQAESGMTVFGLVIEFMDPRFSEAGVTIQGGEIAAPPVPPKTEPGKPVPRPAPNRRRFIAGSSRTVIRDASGQARVGIRWIPSRAGAFYQNCQTKIFSFRLDRQAMEQIGFPLAVSCELERNPPQFTISVPDGIEWLDYNLNEVQGKGERSRRFELPSGNLATEKVGFFTFRNGDRVFSFPITVKTLGEDESVGRKGLDFQKSLAVGMASLAYGGDESVSSSGYLLKFSGLSGAFLKMMKFGVHFKNTFNLDDDPKAITMTDLGVSLGAYSDFGAKSSAGVYGQYRSLDYRHLESNGRLQSSQFGIGLMGHTKLGEQHKILANVSMANLGSKVVKSHLNAALGYSYRLVLGGVETWLGLEYEMQTVQGDSEEGASREFSDNNILVSFEF